MMMMAITLWSLRSGDQVIGRNVTVLGSGNVQRSRLKSINR